ncbi:hypothetical protein C8R43DRAFT_943543 [Mycena crocata]|nr:hypothetical protein C8R43DRAFT_943543 [Mycena crocata]
MLNTRPPPLRASFSSVGVDVGNAKSSGVFMSGNDLGFCIVKPPSLQRKGPYSTSKASSDPFRRGETARYWRNYMMLVEEEPEELGWRFWRPIVEERRGLLQRNTTFIVVPGELFCSIRWPLSLRKPTKWYNIAYNLVAKEFWQQGKQSNVGQGGRPVSEQDRHGSCGRVVEEGKKEPRGNQDSLISPMSRFESPFTKLANNIVPRRSKWTVVQCVAQRTVRPSRVRRASDRRQLTKSYALRPTIVRVDAVVRLESLRGIRLPHACPIGSRLIDPARRVLGLGRSFVTWVDDLRTGNQCEIIYVSNKRVGRSEEDGQLEMVVVESQEV